jgi:hypothetical protein
MHRREGAIRLLGSLCYWCYGAFERYGAARVMDFADVTPETIAEAIAEEIGRPVDYPAPRAWRRS